MFIAALFTISSTWKQPRYPSTNECYSAIKRNAVESILMRWMNLETLIQTEVSQKEKDKYCILTPYIWNLERWY